MSETTHAVTTTSTAAARGANKAAKTIIETVQNAGEHTLPQVIETAEVAVALDVPTKVVLNQKLIVGVTAVVAAGIGAGALWGITKYRNRGKVLVEAPDSPESLLVEKN